MENLFVFVFRLIIIFLSKMALIRALTQASMEPKLFQLYTIIMGLIIFNPFLTTILYILNIGGINEKIIFPLLLY